MAAVLTILLFMLHTLFRGLTQALKAPQLGSRSGWASGRLLPPTECSLRSGCAMDERHGAGTLNSTLRGRGGQVGKLDEARGYVPAAGAKILGVFAPSGGLWRFFLR